MNTRAAQVVWTLLAIAAGTGCIPIYTPLVQVSPTTGERLRAIEDAKGSVSEDSAERARLEALRAILVGTPPVYASVIDSNQIEGTTVEGYGVFNPGLYAPLDRERKDLESAHAHGLLTDAELVELLGMLEQQAERSIVRRWFETCPEAADERATYYFGFGGSLYDPYRLPYRLYAAADWVQRWNGTQPIDVQFGSSKPARAHPGTIYMSPRP